MIDCLILGDSIAVGVSKNRLECAAYAHVGINSSNFNKRYAGEFFSGLVIISLGTNDSKNINTRAELEALRARVLAKERVIWILSASNMHLNDILRELAEKHGDSIISPHPNYVSKDGIHPTATGYRWIASFAR
jgi:lysophospholipase L1-like esterase